MHFYISWVSIFRMDFLAKNQMNIYKKWWFFPSDWTPTLPTATRVWLLHTIWCCWPFIFGYFSGCEVYLIMLSVLISLVIQDRDYLSCAYWSFIQIFLLLFSVQPLAHFYWVVFSNWVVGVLFLKWSIIDKQYYIDFKYTTQWFNCYICY